MIRQVLASVLASPWVFFVVSGILIGCSSNRHRDEKKGNRLSAAGSPYLRQHADNPVDWYEWGEEALEKARSENKPLIISIGYSSCHWCHVMEKESFMDTAVARLMNTHFISVKIDREERPDIDHIYLNAAQLITGNAGWPLNAFALADGRPFYAGTYYSKADWIQLLKQISRSFADDRETVIRQASALTEGVRLQDRLLPRNSRAREISREDYERIFKQWTTEFDLDFGGLKGAPKFPMPATWEFLLQYSFLTGDNHAKQITTTTLDYMARGGIYDHLGGGFARYTVDGEWKIPHFEKMLYDNAQLVSLYAHGWQITRNPLYLNVLNETLAFIERELTSPEGGFYASVNADSEGEEGQFYTWTTSELESVLGAERAAEVRRYFQMSQEGNWENGRNILYPAGQADDEFDSASLSRIAAACDLLMQARNARVRPSTDQKILTSWNALMLSGYVDAYAATTNESFLKTALMNANFLRDNMVRKDGSVFRSFAYGRAAIDGFLDDYVYLARAFISLYKVTFDKQWLEQARALTDFALAHFRADDTAFFYYTSRLSNELAVRRTEVADGALPASNAVMAEVLLLLGIYYQSSAYTSAGSDMVSAVLSDPVVASGPYYGSWARLAGLMVYKPFEVAVVGDKALQKSRGMQVFYHPLAIYMGGPEENLPLLKNKAVKGKTIIYVCRDQICKLPVQDVSEAMVQLSVPSLD